MGIGIPYRLIFQIYQQKKLILKTVHEMAKIKTENTTLNFSLVDTETLIEVLLYQAEQAENKRIEATDKKTKDSCKSVVRIFASAAFCLKNHLSNKEKDKFNLMSSIK